MWRLVVTLRDGNKGKSTRSEKLWIDDAAATEKALADQLQRREDPVDPATEIVVIKNESGAQIAFRAADYLSHKIEKVE